MIDPEAVSSKDIQKWLGISGEEAKALSNYGSQDPLLLLAELMTGGYTVREMRFDFASVMKRRRSKKFQWMYSLYCPSAKDITRMIAERKNIMGGA